MRKDPVKIQSMFGQISPWYDFVNHAGSAGQDYLWRRALVEGVARRLGEGRLTRALDLCCGSGDVTFLLARHIGGTAAIRRVRRFHPPYSFEDEGGGSQDASSSAAPAVVGLDFCPELLEIAERRNRFFRLDHAIAPAFVEGDAMQTGHDSGSFDAVTIAFGLRNLADLEGGLREMHRVLRPGGAVGILEFGHVPNRAIRGLYHLYFCNVMPAVGRLLTRTDAYAYLRDSCLAFPQKDTVVRMMQRAGFRRIRCTRHTFGIVNLFTAIKEDGAIS